MPDTTVILSEEGGEAVPSKILETRDSISSIDSDVSLSFDGNHVKEHDEEGAHMADLSDSSSDTGGKDSGCEVTSEMQEPPFQQPNDELADKIVQQVEFYFSDANITKDAFLLKHVKRNKEGYVSLKLISSFKRVKHITKDWRVVAYALKRSKHLQINETGTKLRRVDPLPKYDETTPSRTVVAVNMPIDKPITIENVAELFKNCGEISLIRILRPGNPIPADVRQFINKNPSLSGTICALIEFVQSESARNALQLNETHMKVYELNGVPHPERKKKNKKNTSNNSNNNNKSFQTNYNTCNNNSNNHGAFVFNNHCNHNCFNCNQIPEVDEKYGRRCLRRGFSAHFPSKSLEPAAWLQRRLSASSTEANFIFMPRRLSYGNSSGSSSSRDGSDMNIMRRVSSGNISTSSNENYVLCNNNSTSYFNRRMSSSCGSNQSIDSINNRSRSNSGAFQQSENVVRLPRGPDGSKGFKQRSNN